MSGSARHLRSTSRALWAVTSLCLTLILLHPGGARGQALINEGFDAWPTKPAGWTFNGIADGDIYTTATNYGLASPSLKLDASGDYITTASFADPQELSFWIKGQGTAGSSSLLVDEYYFPNWNRMTEIVPLPLTGTDISGLLFNPSATLVRFSYNQDTGDLAFDDVLVTGLAPTPTASPTPTLTPDIYTSPTASPTPPVICEGFDDFKEPNWVVPAGWTFVDITDNWTQSGYYGVASPSVKLDSSEQILYTDTIYRPSEFTFWLKGQGSAGSCTLFIDEYYFGSPDGWSEVTAISLFNTWSAGTVLGPYPLDYLTTELWFSFLRDDGTDWTLALDDVCIYQAEASPTVTPPPPPSPSPTRTPLPPTPTPISRPGPITGRVYDRVTGVGIANVYVVALPVDAPRPDGDLTDSRGYYRIDGPPGGTLDAGIYKVFCSAVEGFGIRRYRDQFYNQKDSVEVADLVASNSAGINFPLYRVGVYPTPTLPPSPPPTPTPILRIYTVRVLSGDYDGDGSAEIAVFRPASGFWAVRGLTRAYYGRSGDIPVSGDYTGDGLSEIAVFRPSSGLWAVRTITRCYYGRSGDIPVPGDYDGDGTADVAVFRSSSGLWAIRGLTRAYFGRDGDHPIPGDYSGDGQSDLAVFRGSYYGLWAVRGLTRAYFGRGGDHPIPGDYSGNGQADLAVFRGTYGLWAVRGLTQIYHGQEGDIPVPAGYRGAVSAEIAVFQEKTGLWKIRGVTRVYFGRPGADLPATR